MSIDMHLRARVFAAALTFAAGEEKTITQFPRGLSYRYLTGDIDFLPVFDAQRGWGKGGRYRFPEDARGTERRKIGPVQHFTAPADLTLVAAGGHVHPGGLRRAFRVVPG
jgi:hypothetical protein